MFSVRSLPNLLGLFRIITTPFLVWLILNAQPSSYIWAVLLLLIMAITDFADGHLARKMQVISPLGVFLDTISDKIFVAGAIIPMVQLGLVSGWVAFVIIVREFVISGLRSFAAAEGTVIPAGALGKQKLVIQVTAIVWRLLAASAESSGVVLSAWLTGLLALWPIVLGLAVVWTLASGIEYLWKAWPLLRASWAPRSLRDPDAD
jgi:CDP-diacylglycerol--glycerol-3-phosphate 3-phosphatidyltransferase